MSHSDVLEHDTALANKQLYMENIVPEGFIKKIPPTVIWDNSDFREETPSGEGTTHNTNGLLVKRIVGVDDDTESIPCINSESKRSVDPPPNVLEVYHKRIRQGPTPTSYQSIIHEHSTNEHLQSKQSLDITYCLSKLQELNGHILPGWTGYNTLLNSTTIPPLSKLGYLPVIDARPTRMDTVYTILTQSVAIADSLELDNLVLVMDQAIYSKAQQILMQNDSFKERLVIHLGDFHTAMAYLRTIGKRFQDSGLEDILIEADIVAPGSFK